MAALQTIGRELLNEPPQPIRCAMDDEKMNDLVASIRRHGVLLPLVVIPSGDRFEIVDGHRRFIASGMAGVTELPCHIVSSVEESKFSAMLDANMCREDLTPYEEGVQFLELIDRFQWDIGHVMRAFGRSEDYINARCKMVRDYPDVAAKSGEREITWGQARSIMKCSDPQYRAYLLEQATTHGASIRTLNYMVEQWRSTIASGALAPKPHTPEHGTIVIETNNPRCVWCDRDDDPSNIITLPVHSYHKRDLEVFLDAAGINRTRPSAQT